MGIDQEIAAKTMPRVSTIGGDLQFFNTQRAAFFTAYYSFCSGKFDQGQVALNCLKTEFNCLPATRCWIINPTAAEAFLADIRELSEELRTYNLKETPGLLTDNMPKFIEKFDFLVRKFHKIMYDCGYTR